jgi:aminopeptidase-like protein
VDLEQRLERYFDRLWPICRSITGPGYRESLDILSEIMPTERLRFPTGTKVFDWTVPNEWVPHDAYLIDPNGRKRAHFKENNLHLVGYSSPTHGNMSLEELRPHLHTVPEQRDAIPYFVSYYNEYWGFCLSHREYESLPDGQYHVVVETELRPGYVEIGEAVLPGQSGQEVLFSSYLCHPSLANNELSGPLTLAFLYERLAARRARRFTYRFAIMPETIGAVCYLSTIGDHLRKNLVAGYQLTCIGDAGRFTYKESRQGNTLADRAAKVVLRDHGTYEAIPFDPYEGSDERQYCSPGFNLPVGSLMRTRYLRYPQYHTSLDNKAFISFRSLAESVMLCERVAEALELNSAWLNTVRFCEPQLGKRGLYSSLGGKTSLEERGRGMMWLLNLADGEHDLLAVAERSGVDYRLLASVAQDLARAGLLVQEANHAMESEHRGEVR